VVNLRPMAKPAKIDLLLAVAAAIRMPHQYWSQRDLAELCGVSRTCIYNLERKAIRKLRTAARRLLHAKRII
jgi:DNA-binding XRE family transcriptional regulator